MSDRIYLKYHIRQPSASQVQYEILVFEAFYSLHAAPPCDANRARRRGPREKSNHVESLDLIAHHPTKFFSNIKQTRAI